MPWSGPGFEQRHNHALHGQRAEHAAHIANAVLRHTGNEGLAIAVANHWAGRGIAHRDAGGATDPNATDSSSLGGIAPTAQTQNPMAQGMIQRYASLPTEKLTELGAMMGGSAQGQVIQRLLQQRRMMSQQQAVPAPQAAPQQPAFARGGAMPKRADGGDMGISASQGSPWWTRAVARGADSTTGFLHGTTPGRADAVNTQSPAGSYVFPADVVAGLGEGNSLAGARVLEGILNSGPHGIPMPKGGRGMGPPRPPQPAHAAKGGALPTGKQPQTPVALSHGEYVATPEHAEMWGNGDIKAGHRIFDKWVVSLRKKQIEKLEKLPGPVKE